MLCSFTSLAFDLPAFETFLSPPSQQPNSRFDALAKARSSQNPTRLTMERPRYAHDNTSEFRADHSVSSRATNAATNVQPDEINGYAAATLEECEKGMHGRTGTVESRLSTTGKRKKMAKQRPSTWWFIGAFCLLVPLLVLALAFPHRTAAGIRVTGIFVWLEIIWTSGWIIYLAICTLSNIWSNICMKHLNAEAWADFVWRTKISTSFFALSLVAWGSSKVMCRFNHSNHSCSEVHWLHIFRKVLLATIPVSSSFLAKELLMEVILTRQINRILRGKLKKISQGNRIFRVLTVHADESIVEGSKSQLKTIRNLDEHRFSSGFSVILKSIFNKPDSLEKVLENYAFTHETRRRPEKVKETLRRKIVDRPYIEFDEPGDNEAERKCTGASFKQQLVNPRSGREKLFKTKEVDELMEVIDKNDDGKVSLKEWADVYLEAIESYRDAVETLEGFRRSASGVNIVISILLLCIIAIIYAAFFTKNLSTYLTPIWTTFTGLSFALGPTATEFLACCSFVFSRQPYDVGDCIIIEGRELIVDYVCLLYTGFYRPSDGVAEEIANSKLRELWITNLSRSKRLRVTSQLPLPNGVEKVSETDLTDFKEKLGLFIKNDPVCSRYLKSKPEDICLTVEFSENKTGKLSFEIAPREQFNRREETLIEARTKVCDHLKALLPSVASAQ